MNLRSPTEDEKAAFVMPPWMAGIQVCMDASGDVHVDLDSSPPCWNDGIGGLFFNGAKLIYSFFIGMGEGIFRTISFFALARITGGVRVLYVFHEHTLAQLSLDSSMLE